MRGRGEAATFVGDARPHATLWRDLLVNAAPCYHAKANVDAVTHAMRECGVWSLLMLIRPCSGVDGRELCLCLCVYPTRPSLVGAQVGALSDVR